jgi:hypothetical protein
MIKSYFTLTFVLIASFGLTHARAFDPKASVVEIELTKKTYDYRMPWVSRNHQIHKNGILVGQNQILTTADGFSGQYLCRITKGGESRQYIAQIKWIDFYANIAMLDLNEPAFWQDMKPVTLAEKIPQSGDLQIYRWRSGRIEERAAEIIRLYHGTNKMSFLQHLKLSASSEITGAGWAEVVFDEAQLVGLTESASKDNRINILPAPFISSVIEHNQKADNPGLGTFDFRWMNTKNPALLKSKGFHMPNRGVVVTEVGRRRLADNTLKCGDLILTIDGFDVDSEGKYLDPDYGRLSIAGLATRAHSAKDKIPMTIWRDQAEQSIAYTLPRAQFSKSLIPSEHYDAPPHYLVAGGLVFQPLNGPLMRALGENRPILLDYYSDRPPLEGREGIVLLSAVLPDDYNRGYEDIRYSMIDQINGQTIHKLEDVESALAQPEAGFHHIQFMPDEGIHQIVLDSTEMPDATKRILQHYRIPAASSW